MSTAGKVLTVLILLVTVVWLVMMSAVTQLNVNWQEKITAQQKSLDQATDDYTRTRAEGLKKIDQARIFQDETLRVVRSKEMRIEAAKALLSSRTEHLTRLKAQLNDSQSSAEVAKANLATREAEKIANQEAEAKIRAEIDKLKTLNTELRTQLAQLQDDFKRLLAENAAELDKISKAGAARPASSVRTSPSS
jgi:Na+-transporting methylmalonyl-CoA/oxaloacetate decarboxylase gamma subunit